MKKFCGNTDSAEFRLTLQKLYENCAFPQNLHTRKLGEIPVFYVVKLTLLGCRKTWQKFRAKKELFIWCFHPIKNKSKMIDQQKVKPGAILIWFLTSTCKLCNFSTKFSLNWREKFNYYIGSPLFCLSKITVLLYKVIWFCTSDGDLCCHVIIKMLS